MRPNTAPILGNQDHIDGLDYFLEGIGVHLFGEVEGQSYRCLGRYLPSTRNLSALLSHGRSAGKDIAEDLSFLNGELERCCGPVVPAGTCEIRGQAIFRYRRYVELLERPESLLDQVPPTQRLEVASLITRGWAAVAPIQARVNALAWLGVVGLPHLRQEMEATEAATVVLMPEPADLDVEDALDRIIPPRAASGIRAYGRAVHAELYLDYRAQLARLASRTERVA
jgi:hypothetical protein